MRRFVSVAFGVLFCVILLPIAAAAQGTSAASIVGTVKDTSGAVLPGVTIEASSPALIEKVRSTVTDEKGEYRIIELRPGTYSVTFTLPGFSTFKRDGLELGSNFTATVNVDLKVGGLEETVTVSGETPLVDTSNVLQQTSIAKTVLDTVPTGKSIYGFVSLMPAAIAPSNQQDVGGGLGDQTMRITVHGAKGSDTRLMQDGLSYAFNLDNTGREYFVNPVAAQEIVIDTGGGGSAEFSVGGAIVNMISKDGGNKFSSTLFAAGTTDKLGGSNLDDTLRAQGLTSANKTLRVYDLNGVLGGPIVQDKLWFSGAVRRSGHQDLIANLYRDANLDARVYGAPAADWKFAPDFSRPVEPVEDNQAASIRLTWQAATKDKVTFSFDHQWNRNQNNIPILNTGTLAWEGDTVSGQYRCGKDDLTQATWTHPATNKLLFEAGGNYLHHHGGNFVDGCNVSPDRVQIKDVGTNFTYNGTGILTTIDNQWSTNQRFSASYITGSHSFKGGVLALEHDQTTGNDRGSLPYTYTFNNGVPSSLTQFVSPLVWDQNNRLALGAFFQDQWKINRLTVNAGVRYEYLNQYTPAFSRPAGPITDPLSYPQATCIPCWHDINPRLGVAFDPFGSGRTALKASYGSYSNGTTIASVFAPAVAAVNNTTRAWTDSNGDFFPQCDLRNPLANGECGPMANSSFGQQQITTTADPNWITGWNKRGWNRQVTASIDQQLMSGVAMSVGYYRTWYGNFTATDNTLVTPADYSPYCITAPTDPRLGSVSGQQLCQFADINPNKFGQVNNVVTLASNFGNYTEYYNGADVTFQARLPHGAQLGGGLNIGNSVSLSAGGAGNVSDKFSRCFVVDNPTELYHCQSANPYQSRIKINGSYPLPWGLQAAAVFQSLPGASYAGGTQSATAPGVIGSVIGPFGGALLTVTTAQIQPSLARPLSGGTKTVTIDLLAPYSTFLDSRVNQLDLRLSKIVKLQKLRLQANVDVYNVSNANTTLLVNQNYGASWLTPTQIMPARLAKISLQVDF